MNCQRYLHINDMEQIYTLTPRSYYALMRGHSLSQVDKEYAIHKQAWVNQMAKATKGDGKKTKPAFANFEEFFDYEKAVNAVDKTHKKKPISQDKVDRFRDSVREAERLLNT